VKSSREFDMQTWLRQWLIRAPKLTGNIRLAVDIDPMSFL
jgi:primosomal protein N' (replication factor Y)